MELSNSESAETLEYQDHPNQTSEMIRTAEVSCEPQNIDVRRARSADAVSLASDGECCVLRRSDFIGRLDFEGPVRIECHVEAQIFGTDMVMVAESATVIGPIQAPYVLIAGKVMADVSASKRVEIGPSGMLFGNLAAPAVIVHENAKVEGRFIMTHDQRPKHP